MEDLFAVDCKTCSAQYAILYSFISCIILNQLPGGSGMSAIACDKSNLFARRLLRRSYVQATTTSNTNTDTEPTDRQSRITLHAPNELDVTQQDPHALQRGIKAQTHTHTLSWEAHQHRKVIRNSHTPPMQGNRPVHTGQPGSNTRSMINGTNSASHAHRSEAIGFRRVRLQPHHSQ